MKSIMRFLIFLAMLTFYPVFAQESFPDSKGGLEDYFSPDANVVRRFVDALKNNQSELYFGNAAFREMAENFSYQKYYSAMGIVFSAQGPVPEIHVDLNTAVFIHKIALLWESAILGLAGLEFGRNVIPEYSLDKEIEQWQKRLVPADPADFQIITLKENFPEGTSQFDKQQKMLERWTEIYGAENAVEYTVEVSSPNGRIICRNFLLLKYDDEWKYAGGIFESVK